MAFTVKARVSSVERGPDQTRITFSAHYTDPVTGERVNDDWAQATPAFNTDMTILNDVADQQGVEVNKNYTLTFNEE